MLRTPDYIFNLYPVLTNALKEALQAMDYHT